VNFGDKTVDPIAYENGVVYLNQVDTDGDGVTDTDPVIYCDDIVTFNDQVTRYYGRGIIVAKKGFVISGALRPLSNRTESIGPAADPRTVPYMDATECLGLLTQGDVVADTRDAVFSRGGGVCLAAFLNGNFTAPNTQFEFRGSMICNNVDYALPNGLLATQPGLYRYLPKGMPELSGFTARGDWVRR
jgi:hypothetical protein